MEIQYRIEHWSHLIIYLWIVFIEGTIEAFPMTGADYSNLFSFSRNVNIRGCWLWWKLSDSCYSQRCQYTEDISIWQKRSLSQSGLPARPAWPSKLPTETETITSLSLSLSLSEAKRFSLSQNFLVSLSRSRHQHQRPRQDSREHTTFNTQWSDLAFHSQPEHDHGS